MSVSGGITYRPNLHVHWGPIVSYTSMDFSGGRDYFPRKYSAGAVTPLDSVDDASNGAMPSAAWSTYDWTSFYDLGVQPSINTATYKQMARNSIVPQLRIGTGSGAANHETSGGFDSGYYYEPSLPGYPKGFKIDLPSGGGAYTFDSSTSVIYIEGNVVAFPNTSWLNVKALVVTGNLDFNARGGSYTAAIPSHAADEYQHPSAASSWLSAWNPPATTYPLSNLGMHGFLYVGGDLTTGAGGASMCGAIFVGGGVSINTFTLYYDQDIANNVLINNAKITRSSWDEIVTGW